MVNIMEYMYRKLLQHISIFRNVRVQYYSQNTPKKAVRKGIGHHTLNVSITSLCKFICKLE
jgi:hypothetical protein